jgi:hypothetical protein
MYREKEEGCREQKGFIKVYEFSGRRLKKWRWIHVFCFIQFKPSHRFLNIGFDMFLSHDTQ